MLYALQVKLVAHGFSRNASYVDAWEAFVCVHNRHRPSRSICPGKPSPIRSVSSTCASIIAAGRSPASARRCSSVRCRQTR